VSLADELQAHEVKGEWSIGPHGGEFSKIVMDAPVRGMDDILVKIGVDPEQFEVVGDTFRANAWQQSKRTADGDRDVVTLHSYKGEFRKRRDKIDLPLLMSRDIFRSYATSRATHDFTAVVAPSDEQAGKTDHRGGTPELIVRVKSAQAAWDEYLKAKRPQRAIIALGGDGIEGFESSGGSGGPKAYWSNDLSLTQQLDLYASMVFDWIAVTARHDLLHPIIVLAVPSNHGQWRVNGQAIGKPSDDLGLHSVRNAVQRAKDLAIPVELITPATDYDLAVGVTVHGVKIALAHGEECKPGHEAQWMAMQAKDLRSPFRDAAVRLTGHYHHATLQQDGQAPTADGRVIPAWHIRLPTLDGGSSWFKNKSAGVDADPGVVAFAVDARGLRMQDFTIFS